MRLAARLGSITLMDTEGCPVLLATLWRDAPVVLAFVRHFG
jgi:hypothetical protein